MADEVNPPADASINPAGSGENDADASSNGYDNNANGPTDTVRRLQSERDKERAQREQLENKVQELEGHVYGDLRDKAASSFLSDAQDKYPDVEATDLAFATSPEEFETLAKKAQDKYDRVRNKALADAHTPQDDSLTDEQIEKEVAKLEEKPDPRGFQKFLDLQLRRKR